jgi:hypothetical protein
MYFWSTGRLARGSADVVSGSWVALAGKASAVREAPTKGLSPHPAPRMVRVRVGAKLVADPRSYVALFDRRFQFVDKQAVLPLRSMTQAIILDRLLREWIPIDVDTDPQGAWGDSPAEFWLYGSGDLLLREGRIVRLPPALASRIRARQSLRR